LAASPLAKETNVRKYKRIEITAFRRRVTVNSVNGELNNSCDREPRIAESVWLNDADSGDQIPFQSEEGQMIIADAVRSLERRLTLETRAALSMPATLVQQPARRTRIFFRLQSIFHFACPNALPLTRKEK
jgi:hypothetical protein